MRVAYYLDNRFVENVDFGTPWEGNPGTGASEYLQVAIPYFLKHYCGESVDPIILAHNIDLLPDDMETHQVDSIAHAAKRAKGLDVDFFVFRPRLNEEESILDVVDELQLPSIGIGQLIPFPQHIRKMSRSDFFRAFVCVGREEYDFLLDTPIYNKIVCINNGVHVESCLQRDEIELDSKLVVYMGCLVFQKGFHLLAMAWPEVLKRIPDAKLSVIGSLKMYRANAQLGPLSIADEEYERQHIIPHLFLPDGQLHPSVIFHGNMGQEKYVLLRKAAVGVANPSGQTETCCVSAVEMSACHTAVVSGAYYALLDTVLHKQTGLLGRTVRDLADNICQLLSSPHKAILYGENGFQRVMAEWDFSVVCPQWERLFYALKNGYKLKCQCPRRNIFRHRKFLRMLNHPAQALLGSIIRWPSLQECDRVIISLIRKISNR